MSVYHIGKKSSHKRHAVCIKIHIISVLLLQGFFERLFGLDIVFSWVPLVSYLLGLGPTALPQRGMNITVQPWSLQPT